MNTLKGDYPCDLNFSKPPSFHLCNICLLKKVNVILSESNPLAFCLKKSCCVYVRLHVSVAEPGIFFFEKVHQHGYHISNTASAQYVYTIE